MAEAAAGSRRKLGNIIGTSHGHIGYYRSHGMAMKPEWAAKAAKELRLPLDKLVGEAP